MIDEASGMSAGRRALVLGGGGTVGIAWEAGVLAGLQRAGADARHTDLIVGTSAGSVVGTQLALGMELEQLLAAQLAPPDLQEAQLATVDPRSFGAVMELLAQTTEVTPAKLAQVGRLAVAATTVDDATYLQRFAPLAGLSLAQPGATHHRRGRLERCLSRLEQG